MLSSSRSPNSPLPRSLAKTLASSSTSDPSDPADQPKLYLNTVGATQQNTLLDGPYVNPPRMVQWREQRGRLATVELQQAIGDVNPASHHVLVVAN